MCGFAGFVDFKKVVSQPERILSEMAGTLEHRGPDDSGVWWNQDAGVGLAHRRLSIVDLSKEGHQPMTSSCGRYVIAYNGEIYNFRHLRAELEQARHDIEWRGTSDTEVLLEAVSSWGLENTLKACNGMFAFALWDKEDRVLHLARDRFGEKPIYYGVLGNTFLFGSELKALRVHPAGRMEVDRSSVSLFMRYSYVPAPYSIYQNIFKLQPASFVSIPVRENQVATVGPEYAREYWSAQEVAKAGLANQFEGTVEEAIDELDAVMKRAVATRMIADVPLGAFLSGGIDSSTIVAMMQAGSEQRVRTFSIGNLLDDYDEAPFAKRVADKLGTEHVEMYVSPEDSLNTIPKLPSIYDEPFADSSQIPTTLLSELTRSHVTVSLSGDGGDELFAGYNRHFLGRNIWNKTRRIPNGARRLAGKIVRSVPPALVDRVFAVTSFALPRKLRGQESPGRALEKIASILSADSSAVMYKGLTSTWQHPDELVLRAPEAQSSIMNSRSWPDLHDITNQMMYLDVVTYLPDDILVKVDRASMSASLETRVPFLDPEVLEFAWRLPLEWKVRNDEGKWILRQLLYRYVPKDLVERPKKGFGVPIGEWLRGPLRDWAESLMETERLKEQGYLNPTVVNECWQSHLSGSRFSPAKLWNVLMFQAWLEEYC